MHSALTTVTDEQHVLTPTDHLPVVATLDLMVMGSSVQVCILHNKSYPHIAYADGLF